MEIITLGTVSLRRVPSATERMRLHRERRRKGFRAVRILLHATDIDALVRKGYLAPHDQENLEAIQFAISDMIGTIMADWK